MMIDSIGGRKLLAGVVIIVVGIVSVLLKGDIPPNLLTLLEVVFGGIVSGNVIEHLSKASIAKSQFNATVVEDEEEVNPGNDLSKITEGLITVQELLKLIIRRSGIDRMPDPK